MLGVPSQKHIMTISLPQTNRAPVFHFKVVLCNLSNLPHQGEKRREESQGKVWTVWKPHWTFTAGSSSVSLTAHLPTSNAGYKGFLIRVAHKLSNLDILQPSCPKGDTEQKLHQNLLPFLCQAKALQEKALLKAFICLRDIYLSPMAESCKLRALHMDPELLCPPNLLLQIFWTKLPASLSGILKDLFSLPLEDLYESSGKSLPSKKHQQILQFLWVLMWELGKPEFLERNLL